MTSTTVHLQQGQVKDKTAFVLAGGGSFGAIQVGMLRELVAHGVVPDLVVGASVGALNGIHICSDPTAAGVARLEAIGEFPGRFVRTSMKRRMQEVCA